MQLDHPSKTEIIYAEEKYIQSFHRSLDLVAKEKIYIEMIEALPLEKIQEHQSKLIKTNYPTYYAVHNDEVVGWVDISASANPRYAHRGFLGMGLIDGFRGQGLGTKLITKALDHAKQIGLEKVELEVYASNPAAIALYKKVGFQQVGYKKHNRKLDGKYFDIIQMELFF